MAGAYGVRQYSVAVEHKSWSGAERGEGTATTTTTAIAETGGVPPKVRWLSSEEVAVGGYEDGTVEIGPITPSFTGGGTSLATILPTLGDNATMRLVLTGPRFPTGAYCRVHKVTHDRGYQYKITATPIGAEV
jgi:hypothetical protein